MLQEVQKMTQDLWDKMSNKQRHDYLSAGEVIIKMQTGLRTDAKIGDPDMFATTFAASCRGVQISSWCETNEDAMKEASAYMESLAAR